MFCIYISFAFLTWRTFVSEEIDFLLCIIDLNVFASVVGCLFVYMQTMIVRTGSIYNHSCDICIGFCLLFFSLQSKDAI
jgi:hypothetical protein